jgi:hypothetical protein
MDSSLGRNLARTSFVAMLVSAGIMVMIRRSPDAGSAIFVGLFAACVVSGLLLGLAALLSMFRFGTRQILIPALLGVLLNASIIAAAAPSWLVDRAERLSSVYELESEPLPARLTGRSGAYRLDPPGPSWRMRSRASIDAEDSQIDVWLVDPSSDAHLVVWSYLVDAGTERTLNGAASSIKSHLEQGGLKSGPLQSIKGQKLAGLRFDGDKAQGDLTLRYRVAVFVSGRHVFQLMCYVSSGTFASLAPSCDRVFASFEFAAQPR